MHVFLLFCIIYKVVKVLVLLLEIGHICLQLRAGPHLCHLSLLTALGCSPTAWFQLPLQNLAFSWLLNIFLSILNAVFSLRSLNKQSCNN